MFLIQFLGMISWAPYFSNFANHRMGLDQPGFHQDSVFHVAIIQGILNTGRPTTGQHLEPWASYHALSHYVDAIALFFLGLDPWESYALLFFAKGVAISLAVIYFSMKVAQGRPEALFWVTLLIVYPAFTATWHIIGSHAQWFPMILLALVSYRVFVIGTKEHQSWKDYLLLTVLVLVFSFGKVSIGFAFALIVGLWLFFRRPVDLRVFIMGMTWVALLAGFSIMWSPDASSGTNFLALWSRFTLAWPYTFASILVCLVIGFVTWITRAKYGWSLTNALVASALVMVGVVVVFTENPSDVFYFFQGFFSVSLFLTVAFIAQTLLSESKSIDGIDSSKSYLIKLLAFAGALLFAVSPVASKGDISPYSSFNPMLIAPTTISNHTFLWFNESAQAGERLSLWRAIRSKPIRLEDPAEQPWASRFRNSLHDFIDSEGVSKESPILFLTAEQFAFFSDEISPPQTLVNWPCHYCGDRHSSRVRCSGCRFSILRFQRLR